MVGLLGAGALQRTVERAMDACDAGTLATDDAKLVLEALAQELKPVLAAVDAFLEAGDAADTEAMDAVAPDVQE